YDFTEFCDFDIGENGFYGYEYLPLYWRDQNRFPFLIYVDNKLAGFVLVQKGSPISEETQIWDIAEFFIMKKYKKRGIGTIVAHKIWQQFNGYWQIRVLTGNQIACSFWLQAIKKFTSSIPTKVDIKVKDEDWIVYKFESMSITTISSLYYKAEDYFFRSISIKSLSFSNLITAYMTGIPIEDLNILYIRARPDGLNNIINQSKKFYESEKLPFVITISEELCVQEIKDILKDHSHIQTGKSVSMYTKLGSQNLVDFKDDYITELNNNLDTWMLPLTGAFESTPEIISLYSNRHKDSLKNGFKLYHFSLHENGEPISSITLSIQDNLSRIDDVATLPVLQHNGYATRLLKHALSAATKLGVEYCFLESSDAGLSIYQKLGFNTLFKNNIYSNPSNIQGK
ncbi:MAG: Acetyltransferase, family, partial [Burkholderiales bacterium]|nr:Acetyltransferase, family [Burkholderiales bacterium]